MFYVVGAGIETGTLPWVPYIPSVVNCVLPCRIVCGVEVCVHLLQPDADACAMALNLRNPQTLTTGWVHTIGSSLRLAVPH